MALSKPRISVQLRLFNYNSNKKVLQVKRVYNSAAELCIHCSLTHNERYTVKRLFQDLFNKIRKKTAIKRANLEML